MGWQERVASLAQKGKELRQQLGALGSQARQQVEQAGAALQQRSTETLQTARVKYQQFAETTHLLRTQGEEYLVDAVDGIVDTQVNVLFHNYSLPASIGVTDPRIQEAFKHEMAESYLTHVAPGVLNDVAQRLHQFAEHSTTPRVPRSRRIGKEQQADVESAVARVREVFDQYKGPALHVLALIVEHGGQLGIKALQGMERNVESVEEREISPEETRVLGILHNLAEDLGTHWAELRSQGIKDIGSEKARAVIVPILQKHHAELLGRIVGAN